MVTRITYMGCEDGSPPKHSFKHPGSGDVLGFNIGRPLLINPMAAPKVEDQEFYQSVIDAANADDHFRVEDVPDADFPFPLGAVTTHGYSPGMGAAPEYVPPEAPIGDPAAAAAADSDTPSSRRRSKE